MLVRALRHLAGVPVLELRPSVLGTGETRVFRGLLLWSIEELEASAEEFAPADLPGLVGRLTKRGSHALHLGRRMTRRPSSTPPLRWRDPRHLSTMDEKAQGGLRNNARRHHMPSADEYGRIPTDAAPVTSASTLSPIIHNASAPAVASRIWSKGRGSCS